ncbi:MAG: chemotaxis protein CheW [Deltaproteobacteria bacterium]|nr:chemotaxis protein CheW [Deltaproteobacteria bacterium]
MNYVTEKQDSELVQLTAFRVGQEEYVVDIMRVREIIRPLTVTKVRKGPRFVEGVINLRGEVIPIVDLRVRFELPPEDSERRRIIILMVEGRVLGIVVDSVTEVVRAPRNTIRGAPGIFTPEQAPYFLGVCQYRGRTLLLLNVKNVVASEDSIDVVGANEIARSSM